MSADDPNPGIDYAAMMQRALRGVVRAALGHAAEYGLDGGHHFYVSFDTAHPGVDMPDWLRAQYPEQITIVLEHEFRDLAVTADRFTVRLSFSNRPAHLTVPLDAIRTFVDPHAEFGLKFDPVDPEAVLAELVGEGADDPDDDPDPPEPPRGGAEVVSLDRFRKT